jgi:CDP-diacylglycerol--glycerol-3-phosphate 3-phosphatidyltransferase
MRTDLAIVSIGLAIAFASMPVYALTGARRGRDPLESATRGTFVLGPFVRAWFYWFIAPVVNTSLALGLTPLFFNLLGVAFGIAAGVAFGFDRLVLGGWGILLGGVADIMDGRVARARGVASARGAFIDSTLDRFAEVGAFVGLAVFFRHAPLLIVLVALALGGSLLVSYTRARGESQGVLCNKGVMQRAERLLLLGFGAIFDPTVSGLLRRQPGTLLAAIVTVIAVGTVATAVYRTIWIAARLPDSPA